MSAPLFLTLAEVMEIHANQIALYGGRPGIRSLDLLKSAISMPQAGIGDRYFHEDLYEMAAAYLYHIVRDHPFIDGNKRCAVVAALVFLRLNGVDTVFAENQLERLVRRAAGGSADKKEIAGFLRAKKR
jgi:death on curing protein